MFIVHQSTQTPDGWCNPARPRLSKHIRSSQFVLWQHWRMTDGCWIDDERFFDNGERCLKIMISDLQYFLAVALARSNDPDGPWIHGSATVRSLCLIKCAMNASRHLEGHHCKAFYQLYVLLRAPLAARLSLQRCIAKLRAFIRVPTAHCTAHQARSCHRCLSLRMPLRELSAVTNASCS